MKNLIMILAMMSLVACNGGGGSAEAPVDPGLPEAIVANPDQAVQDPYDPSLYTVTVYSLSRTEAPVNGWSTKTYTATGSCTAFDGEVYCWDDGMKTIDFTSDGYRFGPFNYSYFETQWSGSHPQNCHGACTNDFLEQPILIDMVLENMLASKINAILNTGAQTEVVCQKVSEQLICGSTVIELGAQ